VEIDLDTGIALGVVCANVTDRRHKGSGYPAGGSNSLVKQLLGIISQLERKIEALEDEVVG
jgi:hypothetical protein